MVVALSILFFIIIAIIIGQPVELPDEENLLGNFMSTTEEQLGYGLGIVCSKTLIESQSGRIGITNNPNGADLWFELPE